MASEGWCRACGRWFTLPANWKLPPHDWHNPRTDRDVRCKGANKRPGRTRPA